MNKKMQQAEAKKVYALRKIIVEPVIGQIKNSGFRGFSVRGKIKVAGEFELVCTVLKSTEFSAILHDPTKVT